MPDVQGWQVAGMLRSVLIAGKKPDVIHSLRQALECQMPTQSILIILIINNQRDALCVRTALSKHRTVDGSHRPSQGTPLLFLRGRSVVSMDAKPALDAVIVRSKEQTVLIACRLLALPALISLHSSLSFHSFLCFLS